MNMKRYHKLPIKLTAAVLAVMLIVSAFSGLFGGFTSNAAYVEGTDFTASGFEGDAGKSLPTAIANSSVAEGVKVSFYNGTEYKSLTNSTKNIIDGDLNTENETSHNSAPFYDLEEGATTAAGITKWYMDGSERYLEVVLTLKDGAKVSDILIGNHPDSTIRMGRFEVFIGNDTSTLFNAANSVKEFTEADNKTPRTQHIDFADNGEVSAKYVGMRVYNTINLTDVTDPRISSWVTTSGIHVFYPRIMEFNAYGTAEKKEFSVKGESGVAIPSGTSAVEQLDISLTREGVTYIDSTNSAVDLAAMANRLIDGNGDGEVGFMICRMDKSPYPDDEEPFSYTDDNGNLRSNHFVNFTYTMKNGYAPTKLIAVHHNNEVLRTGKYSIYMSNNKDTLYTSPEKSFSVDNSSDSYRTQVISFNDGAGFEYKYVGVRVEDPLKDITTTAFTREYHVPRFYELDIRGKKIGNSASDPYTITSDDQEAIPTIGADYANLAKDVAYKTYHTTPSGQSETTSSIQTDVKANFNDGDAATDFNVYGQYALGAGASNVKTEDDGYYTDIVLDLESVDTISKFFLINHQNSDIRLNHFKIFASNNESALFNSSNMVVDAFTEGAVRNVIALNEDVKARYIGLRASDVLYNKNWTSVDINNVYLRLNEFGIIGKKGQLLEEKLQLKQNDDVATWDVGTKTTAVSSYSGMYYAKDASSGVSGTAGNLVRLNDNTIDSGEVEFYGKYFASGTAPNTEVYTDGSASYNLTATLNGRLDISDIVFCGHPDTSTRWATSYELYVGDDKDTLYDATNLVYTFDNLKSKTRTQHFVPAEGKTVTGRFVGMRITACTTFKTTTQWSYDAIYPRIMEFNVFGTEAADPGIATVESGASITLPTGAIQVNNVTEQFFDGTTEKGITTGNAAYLTDGKFDNEFMGNGETLFSYSDGGTTKYYTDRRHDIILKLKNPSDIQKIYIANHTNPDLATVEYALYASNDIAKLFNPESKVAIFKNSNGDATQLFTVKDSLQAQYVALRVTTPCKNSGSGAVAANGYVRLLEFNVYGVEGDDISVNTTDAGVTIPSGTNFLSGMSPKVTITDSAKNKTYPSGDGDGLLTDGDAVTANWYTGDGDGLWFIQKDESDGIWKNHNDGTVYCDIRYDFGGTATVEKIYISHHSTDAIRTGKFAVYASADEDTLFEASNLVKTIENYADNFRAHTVTFSTPIEGVRAIGIRIYDPCRDYSSSTCAINQAALNENYRGHNIYPRLAEIAAIGSFKADAFIPGKVNYLSGVTIPSEFSFAGLKNLAKSPIAPKAYQEATDMERKSSGSAKLDSLNDDNYEGSDTEFPFKFADYENDTAVFYRNGERFLDVYYDLKAPAKVSYAIIVNHKTPELQTGKYKVYTSNDKDSLYNDENLFAEVDNRSLGGKRTNLIDFRDASSQPRVARYVGIRVTDPCSGADNVGILKVTKNGTNIQNNVYTRLMEFAVHGTYVDPNFDPNVGARVLTNTKGYDLLSLGDKFGETIHVPDSVTARVDDKQVTSTETVNKLKSAIKGDGTAHVDGNINGYNSVDKPNIDIYMPLKVVGYDICEVTAFAYQGIASDSAEYYTGHYQIYVGEEIEDLYQPETLVFEYNAFEDDPLIKGVVYEFDKKNLPQGNFIGMRIIDPVYSATEHAYPRISLFKVFGRGAVLKGVPANLAENMPITPNFIDDGKRTNITEANLTANEVKNFTDSSTSTYGKINTKAKNRKTVEILYNLCGDMKIDSLWVSALINSTTGFKKMKVYASNSASAVYDEDSLIWTYKVGSKTGTIKPTKTFKNQLSARYLRFVFEDTKDYLQINEIYANGLDHQKMKTRKILNSISTESMSVTKHTKGVKDSEPIYVKTGIVGPKCFDNDRSTYMVLFDDSVIGKNTYQINFDLEELKTISNISIYLQPFFEHYWPGKIRVYISETIEEYENSLSRDPDIVITKKDFKKGLWDQQIRPKLARYIKFELSDFTKNEEFKNENGEYLVTALVNEITLTGTKVKGMQTDDEDNSLITFEDKELNAKATIMRLDQNDVFTDAVSVRFTPEKATNWQMKSLESNAPPQKILNKRVYKVEFLDMYGNPVTDIQGRSVEISFKLPKEYRDGTAMIGNATDRTFIEVLESRTENNYCIGSMVYWDPSKDNKVAVLAFTNLYDPYWETIGELENFAEGNTDDWGNEVLTEEDYDWIRTDDKRFRVTTKTYGGAPLPDGTVFTAVDISDTAPAEEYSNVLINTPGKTVAVFYDMSLTNDDGSDYDLNGDFAHVRYYIPRFVYNNYTDFEIYHIDSDGFAAPVYSEMLEEGVIDFATDTFSHFAIVGTQTGNDFTIEGGSEIIGGVNGETSPETGETAGSVAAAILALAAAAYVAMHFGKREEASK